MIKSFQFRIFTLVALSFTVIFVITLFFFSSNVEKRFYEAVDIELLERASNISHSSEQPRLRTNEKMIEKVKDDYFQITNEGGQISVSSITSDHLWPVNRDLMIQAFGGSTVFETIRFRGQNHRVIYFPLSKNRVINLTKSLEETEEITGGLNRFLIMISVAFFSVAIVLSWLISKKAISPVMTLIAFAEQLKAGRIKKDFETRVKGKEVERVIEIFNGVMENIRNLSETQKRFTQDVSHEIRSPLTSLRGNIEVSLRKRRSPEEYEDVLRSNLFDVIRLIRITDDLLFLARSDNNIIEIRKNWFDINHLLKAIIERVDHEGVRIIENYKEGLEYYGDINLLEQAFSNIIQNAIKYTPEGGTVTISTEDNDHSVQIRISDSGIGIPEKDIPHIFERFYRVDKERSRKLGGTGLGLSIAKWIIDSHSGTISVYSTVGKGTTFTISLPKDRE
ncbi:MAG: sensor histidine kinase [Thermodesulfovibrionales bacterium]